MFKTFQNYSNSNIWKYIYIDICVYSHWTCKAIVLGYLISSFSTSFSTCKTAITKASTYFKSIIARTQNAEYHAINQLCVATVELLIKPVLLEVSITDYEQKAT